MSAGPATPESDNGTGKPKEALDAALRATIDWSDPPHGDRKISQAFLLGWRIGLATGTLEDIDGLGLRESGLRMVLKAQITGAMAELVSANAIAAPTLAAVPAAETFHDDVLVALGATDPVLARAFHLGCELQHFCDGAGVEGTETAELKKLLLALASKFPPNAAHSVLNSLTLWEGRRPVGDQLRRQGQVWRPILAGEVAARDLLHLSDYVGTAEQVVSRLDDITRQALRGRLRTLAIIVIVLVIVGAALLLTSTGSGDVVAGAGSLIAAFGLTWKGIGQYLGRAAAKGEQALWDAQINWTIAYRMTIKDEHVVPLADRKRRETHVKEWQSWHQQWPDFELDA